MVEKVIFTDVLLLLSSHILLPLKWFFKGQLYSILSKIQQNCGVLRQFLEKTINVWFVLNLLLLSAK